MYLLLLEFYLKKNTPGGQVLGNLSEIGFIFRIK